MRQNDDETLRQFIKRFSQVRNSIPEVSDSSVIRAFKQAVRSRRITEDIALNPPDTVAELFEMADRYATASEAVEWNNTIDREDNTSREPGEGSKKKDKKAKKSKNKVKSQKPQASGSKEVLAVNDKEPRTSKPYSDRGKGKRPDRKNDKPRWCPFHKKEGHDLRNCRVFQRKLEDYYNGKGPLPTLEQVGQASGHKSSDDNEEMPFQDPQHTVEHIYGGSSAYDSKRQLKAAEREVNSIEPPLVNKLPKWSEVTISFEKGDCPIPSIRPGRYPIVVEPTINNCRVNRVLIDGGSSLNILFTSALDEMQVPRTKVRPVRYSFHGIVPGSSAKPIGQVSLPLTFGSPSNFRTEKISFDVVDFDTA